jgi:Na+/melibiose symporter-like transporter
MSKKKRQDAAVEEATGPETVSVASHPKARASIRRIRAQAALAVFALVLVLSLRAGVPTPDALIRGLMWGVGAYFAAWFCAVAVWRQVVLGQLKQAEEAFLERRHARAQAVAEAARRSAEQRAAEQAA